MLLRHGSLPLLLLLWLASAQSATLATLFQAQSTEEADPGAAPADVVPSVEAPADVALNAPAADAHAGRPEAEQQQAGSEGTQGSTEAQEPLPETGEAQEPLPETGGAQEPLPETGEAQEPLPETGEAQEPLPETGGAQEPLPETGEAQEPLPETAEAQEPLPETGEAQEPLPDTLVEVATEPTQSETPQAQDPADLSDDSDTLTLSVQETLPEQEWGEGPVDTELQTGEVAEDSGWGLSGLRGSFQTINGYFDSMVELVGGRNGVCQYRCRHGSVPQSRPGYHLPEPNGCSSSLVGLQVDGPFDLGIPAMTKCCDQLDLCYDTCGSSKYRCDSKFRWCLHSLCTDLKKSLGFVSKVQACESGADALYNTVWTLGCRPYMNSQRAACVCAEEEREEL
ncbi:unnamed protein product [Lota lota]